MNDNLSNVIQIFQDNFTTFTSKTFSKDLAERIALGGQSARLVMTGVANTLLRTDNVQII